MGAAITNLQACVLFPVPVISLSALLKRLTVCIIFAGMQSPGLTAAPAVAEMLAEAIVKVSGAAKKLISKQNCRRKKLSPA